MLAGREKSIGGLDKLGIIPSARGIRFVKRDDQSKLAGLFVPYFYTPAMFGGYRKWLACPGCRRPARILYGVNTLRCRLPRIEVCFPIGGIVLTGERRLAFGAGWARK
jgi:hypothetical protein